MSRLPILMYHRVVQDESESLDLSISVSKLEAQFKFLSEQGYSSFHFRDLEGVTVLPKKSIVITFDDVTDCQYQFAVPLLEKYKLKASFFIPFSYVGKFDYWIQGTEKIMSVEQLKALDPKWIELGYHSFEHRKYSSLSKEELATDFLNSNRFILENKLDIKPVLAYPFGNFPRKKEEFTVFEQIMRENGIKFGLRIGNRINRFPFKNKYRVKRIDIKGEDSLWKFRLKLKIGKLKLF